MCSFLMPFKDLGTPPVSSLSAMVTAPGGPAPAPAGRLPAHLRRAFHRTSLCIRRAQAGRCCPGSPVRHGRTVCYGLEGRGEVAREGPGSRNEGSVPAEGVRTAPAATQAGSLREGPAAPRNPPARPDLADATAKGPDPGSRSASLWQQGPRGLAARTSGPCASAMRVLLWCRCRCPLTAGTVGYTPVWAWDAKLPRGPVPATSVIRPMRTSSHFAAPRRSLSVMRRRPSARGLTPARPI